MNEWSDDWREKLKKYNYDCYIRLCECRNKPTDVILMANMMHRSNPNRTAEECFTRMIEWVGDWNSQYEVTEVIYNRYDWYLRRVH